MQTMRVDSCARFLVAAMLIAVAPLAPAQSDADFVAARTAFEHGDLRRLDALAPARLQRSAYAGRFRQAFGDDIF